MLRDMNKSPEWEAGHSIARGRRGAEQLPPWFASVEARIADVQPTLRPAEKRILSGEASVAESGKIAARSAEAIRARIEDKMSEADENMERISKAFEIFVALGVKGKTMDPTDPKSKPVPGWLGQVFPEVSLADLESDIKGGMDILVHTSLQGKSVTLGIDVTSSDRKLGKKFGRIQDELLETRRSADPQTVKVVVGISNQAMLDALRAWGRDTNRIEVHEAIAIGDCVRKQVMAQLLRYAEVTTNERLRATCHGLAEKLSKAKALLVPAGQSFVGDPLHRAIIEHVGRVGTAK